jgi:hypothetical protein
LNIAEFFITLGVKGDDKSVKQIKNVDGGLKEVASSGIAAKVAILGAVYALEKMMSQSAAAGLGIKQFAAFTGMSSDQLQRWQYLFKRSGVSADEVTSSLQGMQAAIVKWKMGDAPPRGLEVIARTLGDLDLSRLEDATYLMGKLREYAQKEKNVGFGNQMLESMGLTPNAIAALRTSQVELSKVSPKMLYSDKDVGSLSKVQEAWTDLGDKVEHAFGKFTAKHGMEIVSGISMITEKIIIMSEKLTVLAEKIKIFKIIGMAFEGIGRLADAGSGAVDLFSDAFGLNGKGKEEKAALQGEMFVQDMRNYLKSLFIDTSGKPQKDVERGTQLRELMKGVAPSLKNLKNEGASNQTINVNQSLAFNSDGDDASDVADIHQRAVEQAYRLTFSQGMQT